MKHGVIRELAGEHAVRKRCRVFGVARSAYYAAQQKDQRLVILRQVEVELW